MPSFLLDGMLGKLARWLRIAGFDTLFYSDKDDDELILEALASNRVLLTRDRDLVQRAKKKKISVILLKNDVIVSQLNQLKDEMCLIFEPVFSRCPICNGVLQESSKEYISDKVPKRSLDAYDKFWVCSKCQNVYWRGTHWVNILETLA